MVQQRRTAAPIAAAADETDSTTRPDDDQCAATTKNQEDGEEEENHDEDDSNHDEDDSHQQQQSAEYWLSEARLLVPTALDRARAAKGGGGYAARWSLIVAKLERVPTCLSDLSSHPCFARNALCREQLQSVCRTLQEAVEMAERCKAGDHGVGKLQMQSDLDAVVGKLDLNLRDCGMLLKTGVLLGETLPPANAATSFSGQQQQPQPQQQQVQTPVTPKLQQRRPSTSGDMWVDSAAATPSTCSSSTSSYSSCASFSSTSSSSSTTNVRELLARLQIGHAEAKHRALDGLLDLLRDDDKGVLAVLARANATAIVQLLSSAAASPKIREKAATAVCLLLESSSSSSSPCAGTSVDALLVSEGVVPPLVRLAESGSLVAREKAVVSLQRLSASAPETAKVIVASAGVRPLAEICRAGDVIAQSAAAGALRNLSAVPEVRQVMMDEGVVRAAVELLLLGSTNSSSTSLSYSSSPTAPTAGCKEYAAECLQNLTATNDALRRAVVADGGVRALLAYLAGPLPQEPAVGALRNLVGCVPAEGLLAMGLLPRLAHVLSCGSPGAQQAAAACVCKVLSSAPDAVEMKKLVGESGCLGFLIGMLEAKSNGAREVAAQAVASLMLFPSNARQVKRDDRSVPSLVQLLDPSPGNTARKYAVLCLLALSPSKRCRRSMVSYGAIGYLKKLSEMEVPGAKKLLERLQRGKLRTFFFGRRL